MTLARMHARMRLRLSWTLIPCFGVAPNIAALLSEETCTCGLFSRPLYMPMVDWHLMAVTEP